MHNVMYFDYSKLIYKRQLFIILPRGYGRKENTMDLDEMLYKISNVSCYLVQLNTLINEKWYDKQEEFIKCLESIKYDLRIIETMINQEKTKEEMRQKLLNLCKIFNGCEKCPIFKFKKLQCPISNYALLSTLKYKEVAEMYNSVEEWVKNFTLND